MRAARKWWWLALGGALIVWAWWPVFVTGPVAHLAEPRESWAAPKTQAPGFTYRHFDVLLSSGETVHATGTHYILDMYGKVGTIQIKDGATDNTVFASGLVRSVSEVK